MEFPQGEVENVFAKVNYEVDYASAIVPPSVNATSFKIDSSIYTMLKVEGQFHSLVDNDPYQHLKKILEPRSPLVEIVRFGARPSRFLKRVYKGE
ncbi:hypothetical protein HAX54_051255, partial [Datura stramonium]|nr:hypothetical protein [Datura stramonium]